MISMISTFIFVRDFNAHPFLWGRENRNWRVCKINELMEDHNICLLNNSDDAYFHELSWMFHAVDLAFCSLVLLPFWNFSVDPNLYNSDSFPIFLSNIRSGHTSTAHSSHFIYVGGLACFFYSGNCYQLYGWRKIDDIEIDTIIRAADTTIPKPSSNHISSTNRGGTMLVWIHSTFLFISLHWLPTKKPLPNTELGVPSVFLLFMCLYSLLLITSWCDYVVFFNIYF